MTQLIAPTDFAERLVPRAADHMNAQRPSNNDEPYPEAGPQAEASLAGTGGGTLAGREGRRDGEAAPAGLPTFSNTAPALTPGGAVDAAPPEHPSAGGAAFLHFTESVRPVATAGPDDGVPAQGASCAGRSIELSDHTMILVRAIAAFERCVSNEDAIVIAIKAYAGKTDNRFLSSLARAVLDERERNAGIGPVGDIPDDLGNLPDFDRSKVIRFSGARKAPRNDSRGLRR